MSVVLMELVGGASREISLEGEPVEIASDEDGFLILLTDRAVRLSSAGDVEESILLPEGSVGTDIDSFGGRLFLSSLHAGTITVWELDGSETRVVEHLERHRVEGVRLSVSSDAILLIWKESRPQHIYLAYYDLWGARIAMSGGAIDGPALLQETIFVWTKWGRTDDVEIGSDGSRSILVWPEGSQGTVGTFRDLMSASIDHRSLVSGIEPRRASSRAQSQFLTLVAPATDDSLVIWSEGAIQERLGHRAALVDADGNTTARPELPDWVTGWRFPRGVTYPGAVTYPGGFVVFGPTADRDMALFRISSEGELIDHDPISLGARDPVELGGTCAEELCLFAWREASAQDQESGSVIRIARFADGEVLDPGGVPIHSLIHPAFLAGVDSNGTEFLITWGETVEGGGTILSSAVVSFETDWAIHISSFAAAPRTLSALRTIWTGEHYFAFWRDRPVNAPDRESIVRGMSFDREGHALDGEETSWKGWPLELDGTLGPMVARNGSVRAIVDDDDGESRLVEITSERTVHPIGTLGNVRAQIEWISPHRLLLFDSVHLEGDPYYRADRLRVQPVLLGRSALVRRP